MIKARNRRTDSSGEPARVGYGLVTLTGDFGERVVLPRIENGLARRSMVADMLSDVPANSPVAIDLGAHLPTEVGRGVSIAEVDRQASDLGRMGFWERLLEIGESFQHGGPYDYRAENRKLGRLANYLYGRFMAGAGVSPAIMHAGAAAYAIWTGQARLKYWATWLQEPVDSRDETSGYKSLGTTQAARKTFREGVDARDRAAADKPLHVYEREWDKNDYGDKTSYA
jgi:hypothetical protein